MERLLKLKPAVGRFAHAVALVSFVSFLFIAALCVTDVALDLLLHSPIVGAYELVQQSMICGVFCAFAYGQTEKSHINMTIFLQKMPQRIRMAIFAVMQVLSVGISVLLSYAAGIQIITAYTSGTVTGMLYIPLWPFYVVEFLAVIAFTLTLLYDTLLSIGGIFSSQLAQEVQSSWS